MREILFRGKRTDNGKWVIGLLARYNPKYEITNIVTDFDVLVPVYTKTVGQFTGLTDKNGKKIFGGDIIKQINSYDKLEMTGFVRFSKFAIKTNCEIIGNIYDNPELLEV